MFGGYLCICHSLSSQTQMISSRTFVYNIVKWRLETMCNADVTDIIKNANYKDGYKSFSEGKNVTLQVSC